MIPPLYPEQGLPPLVQEFLQALPGAGYGGDMKADYASRLVHATDNSIYQLLPQVILAPKTEADITVIARLAAEERFRTISLTPRGGGTGTNGQSLNHGIIIDCSRYLTNIMELDAVAKRVTVQPGVILDQLNAELKKHGLFFPPNLSPSNRATLGGMVATDACGKGSRIYGKTSDYIETLDVVLADGTELTLSPLAPEALTAIQDEEGKLSNICKDMATLLETRHDVIAAQTPSLPRRPGGYNLAGLYDEDGRFCLHRLLAGSEGTLALISRITFRLIDLPKHKALAVIGYGDFDDALRATSSLLALNPLAIETLDDRVLSLAQQDFIWGQVKSMLSYPEGDIEIRGLHFVEYAGENAAEIRSSLKELEEAVMPGLGQPGQAMLLQTTDDPVIMAGLWELRKRAVGLLGNMEGSRRPLPFIEDTAVPPERLADYIADLRTMLDSYGLEYGMFGHVDAGCLHVRPALDLQQEDDEVLIRTLSDKTAALVERYGGVMWGEHGKGFRAEYTAKLLGKELYDAMRCIKQLFDPDNRLNPGKIATAAGTELLLTAIDEVPMRGQYDRQIDEGWQAMFPKSVQCNGNGACFNYQPESPMCPSYKVMRDRRHSPKGRAGVLREWLRLLSVQESIGDTTGSHHGAVPATMPLAREDDGSGAQNKQDFSHAVYEVMDGCLACKACSSQCPIHVNIPDMKARFLSLYHMRYRRPIKDYLIKYAEEIAWLVSRMPRLTNTLLGFGPIQKLLARLGMIDVPQVSNACHSRRLKQMGVRIASVGALRTLKQPDKTVVLVADGFTRAYDAPALVAMAELLRALGYDVWLAPVWVSGKSRHVKGFLGSFSRIADRNRQRLQVLADCGVSLVGLDASITLTYQQEYHEFCQKKPEFTVHLLPEWLQVEQEAGRVVWPETGSKQHAVLFTHCTEKTAEPASAKRWLKLLQQAGIEAQAVETGCCGMAGAFGHEAQHWEHSRMLYDLSWREPVETAENQAILATGFSCRCQVKRFSGFRPQHPVELLLKQLETV